MITYGIFRRNMDRWLQQVANVWTANKNIKEFRTTQHRTGNGFVQQNMLQNASTIIQRRIKGIMVSMHNEELCCKRKSEKQRKNLCEKLITCSGYDVYLYTPASVDYAQQQIRQSVMHALQLRIQPHTIVQTVHDEINDCMTHNGNKNKNENGKFMTYCFTAINIATLFYCIIFIFCYYYRK